MSSDLERFRDHCHRAAAADTKAARFLEAQDMPTPTILDQHRRLCRRIRLWQQLADEVEAYLADREHVDDVPLPLLEEHAL